MQLVLERADCKKVRFHDLRRTFATLALEHGMDVKTLSTVIGHTSSQTTLDVYSHITADMQKKAARAIEKGLGQSNTGIDESSIPRPDQRERKTFSPKEAKCHKPGTGGVYRLNDHLYEGHYTPRLPDGKRIGFNVYAQTQEKYEEKLAEMIIRGEGGDSKRKDAEGEVIESKNHPFCYSQYGVRKTGQQQNAQKNRPETGLLSPFSAVLWSEWRDSNSRRPAPKAGALPTGPHPET